MRFSRLSLIFLRLLFLSICLSMIGITIQTSINSNLFKEWDFLGSIPWMRATLWDFYFNIAIISVWMVSKENHIVRAGLWLIAFILLGSIATSLYGFLQLRKVKVGDDFSTLFVRDNRE